MDSSGTPPEANESWNAVSLDTYTQEDTIETNQIIDCLRDEFDLFESKDRSDLRKEALGVLHRILREWIYEAALSKGIDKEKAAKSGGKIFTFGSYSLQVHDARTDIDTL